MTYTNEPLGPRKSCDYRLALNEDDIRSYLGNHKIIASDFETSPDEPYRSDDKAALDPARAHIVGCSFSIAPGTGIYVPIAHICGPNMPRDAFMQLLRQILTAPTILKIAHNVVFESAFSADEGIIIQTPVYDTICAAQMTFKGAYDFRSLRECGLKTLADEI